MAKETGKKAASISGHLLQSKATSKAVKTVAGSDLSQRGKGGSKKK
jgi:hypothetical protein